MFISLVIRTLVAEYIKRYWFQRIDRRDVKEAKVALEAALATVEKEQRELDGLKDGISALIKENDRLLEENIRLRAAASIRRQRTAKERQPPKSDHA